MPFRKPRPATAVRPPAKKGGPRRILHLRATASRPVEEDEDEYEDDEYSEPTMKLSQAFLVVLILHVIAVGGVFAFNMMKARHTEESGARSNQASASASPTVRSEEATTPAAPANTTAATAAPATPSASAAPKVAPVVGAITKATDGVHEVGTGETLTRIAAAYSVTVEAIEKENGLSSRSQLKVGQRLRIPKVGAVAKAAPSASPVASPKAVVAASPAAPKTVAKASPSASPAASVETSGADGATYTVAKGDNPYSIAKRLHISYDALIKANGITDPTKLQIGQKLKVPATKSAAN